MFQRNRSSALLEDRVLATEVGDHETATQLTAMTASKQQEERPHSYLVTEDNQVMASRLGAYDHDDNIENANSQDDCAAVTTVDSRYRRHHAVTCQT